MLHENDDEGDEGDEGDTEDEDAEQENATNRPRLLAGRPLRLHIILSENCVT